MPELSQQALDALQAVLDHQQLPPAAAENIKGLRDELNSEKAEAKRAKLRAQLYAEINRLLEELNIAPIQPATPTPASPDGSSLRAALEKAKEEVGKTLPAEAVAVRLSSPDGSAQPLYQLKEGVTPKFIEAEFKKFCEAHHLELGKDARYEFDELKNLIMITLPANKMPEFMNTINPHLEPIPSPARSPVVADAQARTGAPEPQPAGAKKEEEPAASAANSPGTTPTPRPPGMV